MLLLLQSRCGSNIIHTRHECLQHKERPLVEVLLQCQDPLPDIEHFSGAHAHNLQQRHRGM